MAGDPEWWDVRLAHNQSGAIYVCPLCHGPLHAATEHLLIVPQGDADRRRHAHAACVRAGIESGAIRLRPRERRRWFRRR